MSQNVALRSLSTGFPQYVGARARWQSWVSSLIWKGWSFPTASADQKPSNCSIVQALAATIASVNSGIKSRN